MITKKTTLVFFAGLMAAGGALAQGYDTPTSGETEIKLNIEDGSKGEGFLMLRELQPEIGLGTFSNDNPTPTASADFCVYASGIGDNTWDAKINVTSKDGFALKSSENGENKVAYTVELFNEAGAKGDSEGPLEGPTDGADLKNLTNPSLDDEYSCQFLNASVQVSVSASAASSAPAGEYSDTLTLKVSAD